METYRWLIDEPFDEVALQRLKNHAKNPKQPMGEAWFMGDDRKMYLELLGDLNVIKINDLMIPLREITSGNGSFGHFEEWLDWYDYLLPYTLHRSHETYAFHSYQESLVSAFISCYPTQEFFTGKYPKFQQDILNTLGKNTLKYFSINQGQLILDKKIEAICNELSSTLALCAKYLPSRLIEDWIESLLNIPNHLWRLAVMDWFYGFYEILLTGKWIGDIDISYNNIDIYQFMTQWEDSHSLRGDLLAKGEDFICHENRGVIFKAVENYFRLNDFKEWANAYDDVIIETDYDYFFPEMIVNHFKDLYLDKDNSKKFFVLL